MSKKSLRELVDDNLGKPTDTSLSDELHIRELEEAPPAVGTGLYIYKQDHVISAHKRELNQTRKEILKDLSKEKNWKPFALIRKTLVDELDNLAEQFANFSEVIELCMRNLQLFSLESPEVISFPPLLLSGPPGVGKTRFMSELAKVFGTDFFSLDFSTLSSGFIVTGNSSSWSESKPGFISESIRKSRYANPIFMLDEIDKVSADLRFDPLGAFYSLFESHTACQFKDEYLDIPMNLSGVLWVATANHPEQIPAPIRSRMIEIEIQPPSAAQSREIVKAIYRELLEANAWGKHFDKGLDESVIDAFAGMPPRLMKLELEKALAHAASRTPSDSRPIYLLPDDVNMQDKQHKPAGIGFLASLG
jgi:ATP-dependent Lon protease